MITSEEFDRVQAILGKRGKPRPKNKRLPFNGIITCGECGAMITSEEKFKIIKSTGEKRKYLYHHCTKRKKDTPCHQKSIRHEELKEQIKERLDSITIPKEFLHAAVEILHEQNKVEEKDRNVILKNHQKNYDDCLKSIDNLINLYVSPGNADRSFLSDEEYKTQKNILVKEKTKIESEIRHTEERVDEWMDLTERTFNFATYAKVWFDKGDFEKKTIILSALGQNFELKDGNLAIDLKKSLFVIKKGLESKPLKKARLEPALLRVRQPKNSPVRTAFSVWSG